MHAVFERRVIREPHQRKLVRILDHPAARRDRRRARDVQPGCGARHAVGEHELRGLFHAQTAPPNVNNHCTAAGGIQPGGTFPCLVTGYSNLEPSWLTFDLSLGYDTGDLPANNFLKHIGIQLTINNILDKDPPFEYRISTGGGNPAAFDILKDLGGRVFNLTLTKTW